ncbi:hypothetical protein K505DRAFT_421552 [Melanomma pulvis-pyrius CBS 109.77]|uniref:Uncharacterized protein n=1 Tax=Melanomma pulvis-pyrius CBS 109.77 TaxID=1314802 RepID=A0A6A6WV38_9PLEO|nr:hypothetical protein K505DRAFT_421552 [Melanomma pulvis-pyrius CBS 109.77]
MSKKGRDIRNFFQPLPASVQSSRKTELPVSVPNRTLPKPENARFLRSAAPSSAASASPILNQPTKPPTTGTQTQTQIIDVDNNPPDTSQSSANSHGTKRVVSKGELVVLNSDSDTDSDGLIELELDQQKTSNRSPYIGAISGTTRSLPYIELQENGLRRPTDNHKRPKPSLHRFAQDALEREETARRVAGWRSELDKPIEETLPSEFVMNEDALAGAIDDDDGDTAKRIYRAMQRTNAHDANCVFHIFNEEVNSSSHQESPFPIECLPRHRWASRFEVPCDRDQTFCSGFAQQVFRYQQLPEELASWMIDQVCLGGNEILNAKYTLLLESHPQHLNKLLDQTKLDTIFKGLGVDMQHLNSSQQVVPSYDHESTPKRPLPVALKWALLLIQRAVRSPPFKPINHALCILLHLSFDDSVMSDPGTLHLVQDTIELIMRNVPNAELIPVLNDVVPLLLGRITHPILQSNLVRSLPSKSPLTAYFQRHLALSLLLYPTQLRDALSSPKIPILIHSHLETSPHFKITGETDYISLAARISLLDTGIGPGPIDVPYLPLPSLSPSQDVPMPASSFSEETAFNKEVDALVKQLKLLSNDIVEVGAIEDLTRLEAKDCCERLYHRLDKAVRIGRKKTGVFENGAEEGSNVFFRNLFNKKKPGTRTLNESVDEAAKETPASSVA